MEIKSISLKDPSGLPMAKNKEVLLERVGRILMTSQLERVNSPMFGSLLFNNFLFELPSILKQNVDKHIIDIIERYEPRVSVNNVSLEINKDIADITIEMTILETREPLTFEAMIAI